MKLCFKCLMEKPTTEFYKHSQMRDGYLRKCSSCCAEYTRAHRKNNLDHFRAYDRIRGNRQTIEYQKEWRKKNLAKYQSQCLIHNLLRSKRIEKQSCEECGTTKYVHAHHDDYLKPFDIRWLCAGHHSEWHKKNGEGKNGELDLRDYGIISITQYGNLREIKYKTKPIMQFLNGSLIKEYISYSLARKTMGYNFGKVINTGKPDRKNKFVWYYKEFYDKLSQSP